MLNNAEAVANIAVKNLEAAKKFYQDTLGLTQVSAEGEELIVFQRAEPPRSMFTGRSMPEPTKPRP